MEPVEGPWAGRVEVERQKVSGELEPEDTFKAIQDRPLVFMGPHVGAPRSV